MEQVLVLGSGKIGLMVARFLDGTGDYRIRVADVDRGALARVRDALDAEIVMLDASDAAEVALASRGCTNIVSAMSYRFNPAVARIALESGASYFDLTEDLATARRIKQIASAAAAGQIFMPQCGLAPGFISILAYHMTTSFDTLDSVHMRVGALPQFPSNALNYNLTWSTDGLINEYCNPCEAIHDGSRIGLLPLEGLESFSLDGIRYEAFNTSGGLGTLCETLAGRTRELNYRTIRYAGHRDLMAFLLNDLRLSERRDVLKDILENAVPVALQDVVVIFCSVTGRQSEQLVQVSDARKIYPRVIDGEPSSAIQITTAAGVCAAVDLHLAGKLPCTGFVKQEDVRFEDFMENRFGRFYRVGSATVGSGSVSDSRGCYDAGSVAQHTSPASRAE